MTDEERTEPSPPEPQPTVTVTAPPTFLTPAFVAPIDVPGPTTPSHIPLATTRNLLPTAFDLVTRASDDMRRASFYVGAVTLGTVGPLALGLWALVVADITVFDPVTLELVDRPSAGPLTLLVAIAFVGFLVAAVESRTLATAVLGGRMAGRPITLRHAVARARSRFWPAIGASMTVGIVLAIAQAMVDAIVAPVLGAATEATVITSTVVTATIGAPFAYVLCGIVLGDVGVFESVRRSVTVARARKGAAAIIVTFETITFLLILFGVSAGADVVLRFLGVLGIGPDSGPAGLAIATLTVVAAVFALGTLLYTVTALTVAPQVVMFVGLTHATIGLDRVDLARHVAMFSRPMLAGVVIALVTLVVLLSTVV